METYVHKVFVSYHHKNDQTYRDELERILKETGISIIKSVQIGDIDENLDAETIRHKIRDEYLRDSTVTVVLIGTETWKRKHVDWEIGSSIRDTKYNSRSGLLGILLPTHPSYGKSGYNKYTIPPRLQDNVKCEFAKIYNWTTDSLILQQIIHEAFERRDKINPDNSRTSFKINRSGSQWYL